MMRLTEERPEMTISISNSDYTTCVAAMRRCLANGTHLTSEEKQLVLDVLLGGTQSDAAFTDIAEDDVLDGRAT